MPRVFVAGIGFDPVNEATAVRRVEDALAGKISVEMQAQSAWGSVRGQRKFLLVTPNPEMVLVAQRNENFKKVLNTAALAVPDGIGILWASYFLSLKRRNLFTLLGSLLATIFAPRKIRSVLPARVTGTDLLPKLCELAAQKKRKVFLLGAAPGVAEKLRTKLESRIADLTIAGTFAGSPLEEEEAEILLRINRSGAELLFVAFGAPYQELWLARNLPKMQQVKLAAGIGGAFDFHAGLISRAPRIFRSLGLEWLWRLIRQPKRFRRIWNATFRFVRLVWKVK